MKTRNAIAMALTIVLSLAAGSLLIWQVSPRLASDKLTNSSPEQPLTPPAESPAESPAEPPEETATTVGNPTQKTVAGATPSIPRSIRRICKNGFTIDRNPAGDFQGYSCNRSAYENYSTEALESLAYGDA